MTATLSLSADAHDEAARAIAADVDAASAVAIVGGRTQWEVGGPPPSGTEVRAPAGVVEYEPAELTITVGAGTRLGDLRAVTNAAGQEVGLDDPDDATVGGCLAVGCSGRRRLRHGPVRDLLLEARFVTGDGRLIKAGGPTVKNVTGFDIPRLLVGSLGALAVITRVTLRCRPLPRAQRWFTTTAPPTDVLAALYRPSAVCWDGSSTSVLLEGHPDDVAGEADRAVLRDSASEPRAPSGAHAGRVSVAPERVEEVGARLVERSIPFLAQAGVGTMDVASEDAGDLVDARRIAERHDGWMLRLRGAEDLDGFGTVPRVADVHRRLKEAFDPWRKLGVGRVPW